MDYTDTNTVFLNGEPIIDHDPLGVSVHQETYAWNFPFANFFVIFNYWIKNVSNRNIDSVFVGMWTDAVVRNTNITCRPSGSAFYNKGGDGYNDSIKIAYEFDAAGDVGFTDSYIGIQYLGSNKEIDTGKRWSSVLCVRFVLARWKLFLCGEGAKGKNLST